MEIKGCKLIVTNIKISVKLAIPVSLQSVEERCKQLSQSTTIYCKRKKNNILTIRYSNFTYILFKRSSKTSSALQHCNITKLKTEDDILKAIEILFFIVDKPQTFVNYTIDNYSCCGNIFRPVDIEKFYIQEQNIACFYNQENFPALTIFCPPDLPLSTSLNQCSHVYRSGRLVIVGGKACTCIAIFIISRPDGFAAGKKHAR